MMELGVVLLFGFTAGLTTGITVMYLCQDKW